MLLITIDFDQVYEPLTLSEDFSEMTFNAPQLKLVLFKTVRSKKVSGIFKGARHKNTITATNEINDEINQIISDTAEDIVIIPDVQRIVSFRR